MHNYNEPDPINIGSGQEIALYQLANLVREIVGFEGAIEWDKTKPDGTPRRLLDSSKIFKLGWKPATELRRGIYEAYKDYLYRFGV